MATGDKLVNLDDLKEVYTKVDGDVGELKSAISVLEPAAMQSDIGKVLTAKTVENGKVTEYAFAPGANMGMTTAIKESLLACFAHVAWTDENGKDYYDALEAALYPPATLERITVTYTQSGIVLTTDTLESLRSGLIVTAHYSDLTTETVTDYTLSGTLTVGTSTITVTYSASFTATFTVTVTETPISISAVFTQGQTEIYDTDSLDSLKQYLVVTATYSDSSTAVIPSTDYELSGSLSQAISTITVTYANISDTFNVNVSIDTTAKIAVTGKVFTYQSGIIEESIENGCITIVYTMDEPSTVLYPAGVIVHDLNFNNNRGALVIYKDSTFVNYVNESMSRWAKTPSQAKTEFKNSWTVREYNEIRFSLDTRYLDDSYMYDYTTGKIWFAGRNTPYFGMKNVSEAGE